MNNDTSLNTHKYHYESGSRAAGPVFLLLHGTGGNEHDLVSLAQQLAPGAPLLSPRGNVSEHGALRFFRRHAEGVFVLEDARARADALAAWIRAALAHHALETRPLIALGFSNGANMAAILLQRHPALLSAAILLRPMIVLDEPAAAETLLGKRIFISSGARDPIVPPDHPARLAALLHAGSAFVEMHNEPEAGHYLLRGDLEAAKKFLIQSER